MNRNTSFSPKKIQKENSDGRRPQIDTISRPYYSSPETPICRHLVSMILNPYAASQPVQPEKLMIKTLLIAFITAAGAGFIAAPAVQAHCEIPCGIYDDHARVQSMLEDADTIIKSAKLIGELAGKTDAQSQNQLVRWVTNKEKHAQSIIDTISNYFLTQRVKADQSDYTERLKKHHAVIVAAMKAKQNADGEFAKALKKNIAALASYYPEHKH